MEGLERGVSAGASSVGSDGVEEGSWFKFNDHMVTPFDPREIEATCFGGVAVSTSGVSTTVEHEPAPNAFLLFYEKAVPREESITGDGSAEGGHANAPQEEVVGEKEKPVTVSGGSRQGVVGGGEVLTLGGVPLLDGAEAFSDEVYQANAHFMLNTNVFDPDFDIFLRTL
ncbi:unnamed protein product [Ascophyllum nodosum]